MKVFVIDTNKQQLDPVHPAEARLLLKQQKASVFRQYPFTIILKVAQPVEPEPLRIKIDPGSKTTGLAIVKESGEIVFAMELVRFDMQKIQNPEIAGTQYQQGALLGYEVREYLLEKWNRTCVYCGAQDTPLEVEHIVSKSKGGSNRVSNLTLACNTCNQRKNNQPIEQFLQNKPELLHN
ncbi:MAG: RRXRR domain-containing protein [Desulfobacteraceae bacterium]